jgi:hypothetical protein
MRLMRCCFRSSSLSFRGWLLPAAAPMPLSRLALARQPQLLPLPPLPLRPQRPPNAVGPPLAGPGAPLGTHTRTRIHMCACMHACMHACMQVSDYHPPYVCVSRCISVSVCVWRAGQVVLLAASVFWTAGVEGSLQRGGGALKAAEAECGEQLRQVEIVGGRGGGLTMCACGCGVPHSFPLAPVAELTPSPASPFCPAPPSTHRNVFASPHRVTDSALLLTQVVGRVRGELSNLQRATLGALVVMDVHARDVVRHMTRHEVT